MPNKVNGHLVEIETKFHAAATRPGGVSRGGARLAADRSMADLRKEVERQVSDGLVPLIALLRGWPDGSAEQALTLAGRLRDCAGLADMQLLGEVAMHCFDCLDAVLVEGAKMDRAEAVCYADALAFAQQERCRGSDLEPFRPLIKDLETLTTLVIDRARAASVATPAQ